MNLWQTYKTTVFLSCDNFPALKQFAIVTAWNPNGKLALSDDNFKSDKTLNDLLVQQQLPQYPIYGCSPDLTYREKSRAVEIDKATAVKIGKQFRQNAIFWVENDKLFLIPCLLQEKEECIGDFSSRIVGNLSVAC